MFGNGAEPARSAGKHKNLLFLTTIILMTAAASIVAVFSLSGVATVRSAPLTAAGPVDIAAAKPAVECYPAPSGLISWWAAENNAGDSKNLNNGALIGNAGFTAGKVGNAFNLDGNGDYVHVASPLNLPVGNSPRTVEMWFQNAGRLDGIDGIGLFQYGSLAGGQMFGMITSGNAPGKLYFYGHSSDLWGTTTLLPNTWYHGAITYDATTVKNDVNGQLESSAPMALNTAINSDGLTIGHRPGQQLDRPA